MRKLSPPIFPNQSVRYDLSHLPNIAADGTKSGQSQQLKGSIREVGGRIQKDYGDAKETVKDADKR